MRKYARACFFGVALAAAATCAAQGDPARDAFSQGLIAGRAGFYQKAVGFFDEALRHEPTHVRALYNRGIAHQRLGQSDRAIKDYSEAIRLDPRYADAYANRGTVYENLKQYERAIQDYDQAIRLDPNDGSTYANRAGAYDKLDRYPEAIKDYEQAVRLAPGDPDIHDSFAWLLATVKSPALRDGKRAVELALKACELSQWKEASYIDTLAAAYARGGDFANAVKWQMKALEDKDFAASKEAQERLQLYRANKTFPPD